MQYGIEICVRILNAVVSYDFHTDSTANKFYKMLSRNGNDSIRHYTVYSQFSIVPYRTANFTNDFIINLNFRH